MKGYGVCFVLGVGKLEQRERHSEHSGKPF